MNLKLINVVVFAENFDELVRWYKEALNLEVIYKNNTNFIMEVLLILRESNLVYRGE